MEIIVDLKMHCSTTKNGKIVYTVSVPCTKKIVLLTIITV